jgi:hypothetical protein
MKNDAIVARLKQLENESAGIRQRLGISSPKTVIYQADLNPIDDESIVVEADGFGGATLRVVEGNYPIDFLCLRETKFASERAAVREADQIMSRGG